MDLQKKKRMFLIGGVLLLALIAAVVLVIVLNGTEDQRYTRHYEAAEAAFRRKDYDAALGELNEALDLKKTEEGYLMMAEIYNARGDTEQAVGVLYSGYSLVGGEALQEMLERLKAEQQQQTAAPPETTALTVAGTALEPDTRLADLSGKGLNDADFAALCSLHELESLSVADNAIRDIAPAAALTKLTDLHLSGNAITDISPLRGLSGLKTLYLDRNPVHDLTPLYGLTGLRTLSLQGVEVTPEALRALQEALPGCRVFADVAADTATEIELGGKTFRSDVTELDLGGRSLTDISPLSECRNLQKLNLRDNKIEDLTPLADLTQLEELSLWNNAVQSVTPLMGLTHLRVLDLDTNRLSDISALAYLTELKSLWLNNNALRSISPLSKLTNLTQLGLRNTGVTDGDLQALSGMKELAELVLDENPGLTAKRVEELKKSLPECEISHSELLRTVNLGGTEYTSDATELSVPARGIESLEGLEHFTALTDLNIDDNRVTDLSPLYGLKQLRTVSLRGNGLSKEAIDALRAQLPDCEIIADPEGTEYDSTAVARGVSAASSAAGTGSGYAILWQEGDAVSTGARRGLADQMKNLGMNVVYDGALPVGAGQLSSYLSAIRGCGADTVFLAVNDAMMARLLTEAQALGYAPQFIQVY